MASDQVAKSPDQLASDVLTDTEGAILRLLARQRREWRLPSPTVETVAHNAQPAVDDLSEALACLVVDEGVMPDRAGAITAIRRAREKLTGEKETRPEEPEPPHGYYGVWWAGEPLNGETITLSRSDYESLARAASASEEAAKPDPLSTAGARKWAEEFLRIHGGKVVGQGHPARTGWVDEGDLIAWFANAIETGRAAERPAYGSFPYRVDEELRNAREAHDPIHSLHEGYAVIREELSEFWREVRRWHSQGHKRDTDGQKALKELVQTAAMCQRTAEDRALLDTDG